MEIPISYDDLLRFQGSVVVYDEKDNDTLWSRVYYSDSELKEIDYSLTYGFTFTEMSISKKAITV